MKHAEYVGFCGYCGRGPFHLNYGTNLLGDHGFKVDEVRHDHCYGVGMKPLELSDETLVLLRKDLKDAVAKLEKELQLWQSREHTNFKTIDISKYPDPVTGTFKHTETEYVAGTLRHKDQLRRYIFRVEHSLEERGKLLASVEKAIRDWRPYQLQTADQISSAKKAITGAAKASKQKELGEKAVASLEGKAKRIFNKLSKIKVTDGERQREWTIALRNGLEDLHRALYEVEYREVGEFDAKFYPEVLNIAKLPESASRAEIKARIEELEDELNPSRRR